MSMSADSGRHAKTAAPTDTVLGRLLTMQANGAPGLSDEVIRSYLIGLITGFVPTNTMAAGHMLEMLLRRPDFMAPTRAAALCEEGLTLYRNLGEQWGQAAALDALAAVAQARGNAARAAALLDERRALLGQPGSGFHADGDLDGSIAVALIRAQCGDPVGSGFYDGNGYGLARLRENAGHTALSAH